MDRMHWLSCRTAGALGLASPVSWLVGQRLKHSSPGRLRKPLSCMPVPIHHAGQTDRHVYGANKNLALISDVENRSVINEGGVERVGHGEGAGNAPHSGCR